MENRCKKNRRRSREDIKMKCYICEKELGIDEEVVRMSYGTFQDIQKWSIHFRIDNGIDNYICRKCAIEHNLMCK